jgi:hypothetical protein
MKSRRFTYEEKLEAIVRRAVRDEIARVVYLAPHDTAVSTVTRKERNACDHETNARAYLDPSAIRRDGESLSSIQERLNRRADELLDILQKSRRRKHSNG